MSFFQYLVPAMSAFAISPFSVIWYIAMPLTNPVLTSAAFLPAGMAPVLILTGSAVYLGGVVLVTGLGNVPMNRRLAGYPDASADAQRYWPEYIHNWTRLNHLRTGASAVSAILYFWAAVGLAHA